MQLQEFFFNDPISVETGNQSELNTSLHLLIYTVSQSKETMITDRNVHKKAGPFLTLLA
jgi:hypothetical protein